MAIDPATAAALANAAKQALVKVVTDEETRTRLLLVIVAIVGGVVLIVAMCFYVITLPFGWLGGLFLGDEYNDILALRGEYGYAAMEEPYYDYVDGFDTYGGVFTLPCEGFTITNPYGMWFNPFVDGVVLHRGLDMQPAHHAEIMAVYDGTIIKANHYGGDGYGNCVEIEHELDGVKIYTFYAHLSEVHVNVGDEVEQGDVIGLEGGAETDPTPGDSTGHHLHFEVRKMPGYKNDVDPYPYLFSE